MSARLGRVLLVIALLLAQQAALAHQIGHLAAGSPHSVASVPAGDPSDKSQRDRLCDLHSSLGTVLGALSGALALSFHGAPHDIQFADPSTPAISIAAPVPASRDPPSSL